MYKCFLDTTNENFCLALFDANYKLIASTVLQKLKEKSEALPNLFKELLKNTQIEVSDILEYYLCIGPGKFTGIRVGIIFVRTIAQLTNSKIFSINSFVLLGFSLGTPSNILRIKISERESIKCHLQKYQVLKVNICVGAENIHQINYEYILSNFQRLTKLFTEETDILKIVPYYISNPRGVK